MIEAAPAKPRPEGPESTRGAIRFPAGLLGFPHVTEYRLVHGPHDGLYWLDAEAPDAPRFLLSDPFVFFEGIGLDVSPTQAAQIEAREADQVAVLAITVPNVETGVWTANLQGPVVINVERSLGAQVVLADQSLGVRRPFTPFVPTPVGGTAQAASASMDGSLAAHPGVDQQLLDLVD